MPFAERDLTILKFRAAGHGEWVLAVCSPAEPGAGWSGGTGNHGGKLFWSLSLQCGQIIPFFQNHSFKMTAGMDNRANWSKS